MTDHECDKILDHTYEFLNRRNMTPTKKTTFQKHLSDYPPCNDKFEFERKLLERLKAAGGCQCPEGLKARVQSLLERI
jgi:anti-sigma factor (TIGR02949 family)